MTATTQPRTIWYEPEFVSDAATRNCYCHKAAHGRTRYWNGYQYCYRYQCREHLPAVGAMVIAVAT